MSTDGGGATLGSARGEIVISTSTAQANVRQLQGAIGDFGKSAGDSFKQVATGIGLLATSKKLAGIFTGAIGTAADFEQEISAIGAVADATGPQLDALREKALQIGKDTAFSASQGAQAIEELAKAGVSTEDILNGAADGAVALAAAAGVGLPEAAALISTSLNEFQAGGDQATKFADLFAAAASSSAASAQEIGTGFAYAGGQAHALGISAEDLTTALAILADNGLGERAGTSLNAALSALAAPTTQGAAALDQLGVSAFDAAGNFKGLPELIDDLSKATANLTQEQKSALLADIFGEQGARAILPLINAQTDAADKAGKGWEQYATKITKSGAAAEQAAIRMDNTRGSIEQLRGSVETFSILVGSTFLPAVRDAVDVLTGFVNVLIGLPHSLQAIIGVATAGAAAIAGIAGVLVLAGPRLAAFGEALGTVRTAILGVNPLLLAGAVAIGLLIAAYKTNFGGFADFINGIGKRISDTFSSITKDLHFFTTDFNGIQIKRSWGRAIGIDQLTRIQHVLQNMGRTFNKFNKDMDKVSAGFSRIGRVFKRNGFIAGIQATFGDTGQGILSNFVKAFAAIPETVGKALRGIRTGFAPIDRMFYDAGRALQFFGGALEAIATGDFKTAFAKVAASLQSLFDVAKGGVNLGKILVTGAFQLAGDLLQDFWDWLRIALGFSKITTDDNGTTWHVEATGGVIDVGKAIVTGTFDALTGQLSDFWDWLRIQLGMFEVTPIGSGVAWKMTAKGGVIDVGKVIVNAAFSLVSNITGGIFDWIREQLGLVRTVHDGPGLAHQEDIGIGDIVISVGKFVPSFTDDILDAVTTAVKGAWDLVKGAKGAVVDLGAITVSIASFLISSGASILDAVSTAVQKAWDLVSGAVKPIKQVTVNIADWLVDELTAGTLVADVSTFIQTQLATVNVFMNDWTLRIGAPGDENVSIDFKAIFQAIFHALTVPLTFDPATGQRAHDIGHDIGQKITLFLLGGLKAFFTAASSGSESASGQIGIDTVVKEFFAGIFSGIGDQLHLAFDNWLNQTGDAILSKDAILGKLRSIFIDPFTNAGAQQGFVDAVAGIFGFIKDLFTGQTFDDLQFPDLITPVETWFSGQVDQLKQDLANMVPGWLKDLANGDVLGAVKDLFGSGAGDSSGTTPIGPQFSGSTSEIADNLRTMLTNIRKEIDLALRGGGHGGLGKKGGVKFLDTGAEIGSDIGTGIILGLQSSKAGVAAALADLLKPPPTETNDSKSSDFRVKNPTAVNFPAPNLTALLRGFGDAVNATQDAIRRIVGVVNTLTPQFGNSLQNAMRAFVSALDNGLASAVNNTQTAVSRIIGNANTLISALGNAGGNAGRSFSANVSAAMFGAVTVAANAASALVGAVAGRLSGLGGLGYGIGQQLGFGMANGIASTISAVVSAAVNLVYSALAAARFAALIGSPSKLFAREVGEPIAQGMAVGIDDGHGAVKHSIASLIAAAIPTVSATSLASSPTSHAATLLAQPSAAAVSLGARSNVVNQNTFTLKTEFHGITDTDEIETRVHTSFFRAIDLAASAGLFGS